MPKSKGIFWPKSQIFRPKTGDLQKQNKKRSPPKSEGIFWPKSQIFHPKTGELQKKRSSPKSDGIFWPTSQILTFFPPKNINIFLPKNFRGGTRKKSGGQKRKSGEHCPRWQRACFRRIQFDLLAKIR